MNKELFDTLTTCFAAVLINPPLVGIFDADCSMTRAVKQALNSPATSKEIKRTKKNVNRPRGSKRKAAK